MGLNDGYHSYYGLLELSTVALLIIVARESGPGLTTPRC